jgi:hypothetical protein
VNDCRRECLRPFITPMLRSFALWLLVINLGVAFGAGLYEARVVIPAWADLPPQTWPNTGLLFWVYVTTVPLTLITLANLAAAWRERGVRRPWWLAAVAIVIAERLATFFYFIPTMIGLQSSDIPPAQVKPMLAQWLWLNQGRHALTLLGWLAALKALSLPGVSRKI